MKDARPSCVARLTVNENPSQINNANFPDSTLDYSQPEKVLEGVRDLNIKGIIAGCNDFAALSAAYVCDKLNLPGSDTYEITKQIHHKDQYRKLSSELQLPGPKAVSSESVAEAKELCKNVKFPIMIKPVDLSGGKGINKIEKENEVETAICEAFDKSKCKRIVMEEFIEGSRHGFTCLIFNQKIVFEFVDDEFYYLNQTLVAAAYTPSSVKPDALSQLRNSVEKLAKTLMLTDGIVHVQFIINDDNPYIIELCRRPPGDLYIHLVKMATGFDYPKWLVKCALGHDCAEISEQHYDINIYISRHCIMPHKNGVYRKMSFNDECAEKIMETNIIMREGDFVDNYLIQKIAILFIRYRNREEMVKMTNEMNQHVQLIIE